LPKRSSPDFQLAAGGKSYQLRFAIKAFARLEDYFKVAGMDAVAKRLGDVSQFSAKDIGALLWAGLARHHPEVTEEQALDLADDIGVAELMETFSGAIGAALSEPKGGEPAGPR
jgi:hypothetical protein